MLLAKGVAFFLQKRFQYIVALDQLVERALGLCINDDLINVKNVELQSQTGVLDQRNLFIFLNLLKH